MKKGTIILLVIIVVILILLAWKGKTIFANAKSFLSANNTPKATINNNTTPVNTPPIGNSTQQQNTSTNNNNAVTVAGINAGSNILSSLFDSFSGNSSLFDSFSGNSSVDNLALDTQPSENPNIVDNSSPIDTMPSSPETLNTDGFSTDVTV